jgi:hypothetical protein
MLTTNAGQKWSKFFSASKGGAMQRLLICLSLLSLSQVVGDQFIFHACVCRCRIDFSFVFCFIPSTCDQM